MGLSREYLIKGLEDKIVSAYYDYMVDLAVIYGADKARAKSDLMDSLNFEIALANVRKNERDTYLNDSSNSRPFSDLLAKRETKKRLCSLQSFHYQGNPGEIQLRGLARLH